MEMLNQKTANNLAESVDIDGTLRRLRSAAAEDAADRIEIYGMPIDALTEVQAIERVIRAARERRGSLVLTPNIDILRRYHACEDSRRHLEAADLVLADGTPLVWASRIQGRPLPERVAGSTMTPSLVAAAARADLSVFLLGGDEGVGERAAAKLLEEHPGLRIAGVHCPPFGFEQRPEQVEEMATAVHRADPDIVLIALPFPKQGDVAEVLRAVRPAATYIGVGVSLSFVTGDVRRAPVVLQRLGLEWVHRLAQEPRRLYRRYLVDGIPFALRLLVWSVRARLVR